MLMKIFLICLSFFSTFASHFRGGTFNWQVTSNTDGSSNLDIDYRLAWRMTYGPNYQCNQQIVNNGTIVRGEGYLQCLSGCTGNIAALTLHCTDFSPSSKEDWMTGVNTISQKITPTMKNSVMYYGFQGGAWISLQGGGGGSWSLATKVDLSTRSDTGRINSSPRSAMAPILRLEFGCSYTIRIPVADTDNDVVRCRWAQRSTVDECAGVCQTFPGAKLDSSKCEMQYTPNGKVGWYAVALQIEDFKPSDTTFKSPLSSIPLQFLVYVQKTGSACPSSNASPQFLSPPTPADQSIFDVVVGNSFQFQVATQTASNSIKIIDVDTVSPAGTSKGPIVSMKNNTYSMTITFTPQISQAGPNILCFTAVDDKGQRTNQYCITINVIREPPTTVPPTPASATCSDLDCAHKKNGVYPDPFNSCATHFFKCSNSYCYEYQCPYDIDGKQLVYYAPDNICERRAAVPGCQ